MEHQENQFFVDSEFLSPQALEKKHRLETDPASRKSHLEYLPGMEVIQSEVMEKVLSQMDSYDYTQYTARDVQAALEHETCSVEDFKALLSPAAEPFLERMAQRPAWKRKSTLATRCTCSPPCTLPITAKTTVSTAALTAITTSTG